MNFQIYIPVQLKIVVAFHSILLLPSWIRIEEQLWKIKFWDDFVQLSVHGFKRKRRHSNGNFMYFKLHEFSESNLTVFGKFSQTPVWMGSEKIFAQWNITFTNEIDVVVPSMSSKIAFAWMLTILLICSTFISKLDNFLIIFHNFRNYGPYTTKKKIWMTSRRRGPCIGWSRHGPRGNELKFSINPRLQVCKTNFT